MTTRAMNKRSKTTTSKSDTTNAAPTPTETSTVPMALFMPLAAPQLKSTSHSALVQWRKLRREYEDEVAMRCKNDTAKMAEVLVSVKKSFDKRLLDVWCEFDWEVDHKRPKGVPGGTFKMACAESNPRLVALGWADNVEVYFLASHVSTDVTTIQRREKNGSVSTVPCPQLVKEYQDYMGGVDRHDQLRLQSYSMQLATRVILFGDCYADGDARFPKYYKALFLGLVDMALVNAYIIHTALLEPEKKKRSSHYTFLAGLQAHLIKIGETDFTQSSPAAEPTNTVAITVAEGHTLVETRDKQKNGDATRSKQRQCKVCSFYKPPDKRRGGTSRFYCPECSKNRKGPLTLCNQVRGHPSNEGMTCGQIWHIVRQNGQFRPSSARIRDRGVPE